MTFFPLFIYYIYDTFVCLVLTGSDSPMDDAEEMHAVSKELAPSVVVVEQVHRLDYFCIGSVVRSIPEEGTFILAQAEILESFSDMRLMAHFFDGHEAPAEAIIRRGQLCILRTDYNPRCKEVELDIVKNVDLGYMMIPAPFSRSTQFPVPSLLFQPRLVCTIFGHLAPRIRGSRNYFMVRCQFGDKSANGVSRLAGGPVFSMGGKVVGILVRDNSAWVDKSYPEEEEQLWVDEGFQFKICMSARQFQNTLWSMLGECGLRKGKKRARNERKKHRGTGGVTNKGKVANKRRRNMK